MKEVQVVILNHKEEAIRKFSRQSEAVSFYKDKYTTMIDDLYNNWFGIHEACIIAHHLADMKGNKDIHDVFALSGHHGFKAFQVSEQKKDIWRVVFIVFNQTESQAREYVYYTLRPQLFQSKHQPVSIEIDYHNVTFV